ncbi:MAG TPA: rhomboid family intramembrane serine protease, partial [Tepidisphaeraceae bacterium]|nr:rhomboid family intramembrane serine protease [Tepidisphaeraceae bacterium]
YLVCGAAGALVYLGLWKLNVLVGSPWVPLVGASAGIFGILAAASRVAPRATVMMAFPPMPIELRTWAMLLLGIAALTIIFAGPNAGGEAAHLGGAIAGYLGIRAAAPGPRMRLTH